MISILQWKDLWNWLPSESGTGAFAAGTTPAPMGDFLRRVVSPIDKAKHPLDSLNVVAKISFGGVLHVRTDEEKAGYKGPLFEAKPGDLVFSKIRVGQGSLCVVPNDLGHLAVSPEYPVYRADDRLIRPRFLNLLLRSAQFQKLLRSQASGNTTKKRIRPEDFEALEVPLPVLEEQDEILLRYDAELERAVGIEAEANAREREALQNFEAELGLAPPSDLPRRPMMISRFRDIQRWSHEGILDQALLMAAGKPTERFPLLTFGEVIRDLRNGWSPQCLERPATEDEWGVLKVGAVSYGWFDDRQNKALPPTMQPKPWLEVKSGEVIISRANILRLVGACAIVWETRPRLLLCDKLFRVEFLKDSPILPDFLAEVLKTHSVRQQIEAGATGTSPTMKNISKSALLELAFPVPTGPGYTQHLCRNYG